MVNNPSQTAKSLNPTAIHDAYDLIQHLVNRTPLLTSKALNTVASSPQSPESLKGTPYEGQKPANPRIRLFFKCENHQRMGAFKPRGAFHALLKLIEERGVEEVRRRGVITHSSGNHAQALSLAASTLNIPAYIIMPRISTPLKIERTKSCGAKVIFSGSTSTEREAVVSKVQSETGAILVPPYDDFNIICGQGTTGLELEGQYAELVSEQRNDSAKLSPDAVITPIGGGGLNAGVATYFSDKPTRVFGAEPSFQGGDDCRRGLMSGTRVESVKTLTIADGLRTPVGLLNWEVISDKQNNKVSGVFSVTEEQIKAALRLVLQEMKMVVEPSAVVGLAVCLFDEEFRRVVEREGGEDGWDVVVVLSGGNTTTESVEKLLSQE